jgi:hypothetical protein
MNKYLTDRNEKLTQIQREIGAKTVHPSNFTVHNSIMPFNVLCVA